MESIHEHSIDIGISDSSNDHTYPDRMNPFSYIPRDFSKPKTK